MTGWSHGRVRQQMFCTAWATPGFDLDNRLKKSVFELMWHLHKVWSCKQKNQPLWILCSKGWNFGVFLINKQKCNSYTIFSPAESEYPQTIKYWFCYLGQKRYYSPYPPRHSPAKTVSSPPALLLIKYPQSNTTLNVVQFWHFKCEQIYIFIFRTIFRTT